VTLIKITARQDCRLTGTGNFCTIPAVKPASSM
jgi:hypothetical protein